MKATQQETGTQTSQRVVCLPLAMWRPGLLVFPGVVRSGVSVGWCMRVVAIMASIGQAGHVSIVQIDVGGLG